MPVPPERGVAFRFREFLDDAASAGPHPGFQGDRTKRRQEKSFLRPLQPSLLWYPFSWRDPHRRANADSLR